MRPAAAAAPTNFSWVNKLRCSVLDSEIQYCKLMAAVWWLEFIPASRPDRAYAHGLDNSRLTSRWYFSHHLPCKATIVPRLALEIGNQEWRIDPILAHDRQDV